MNIYRVFSRFHRQCNCSVRAIPSFIVNGEHSRNFSKKCETVKSAKTALLVFTEGSGEILVAVISDILRRAGVR